MNFTIKDTLLPLYMNRPGTKIKPTMVVIHETASPNATDEANYKYFCGGNRDASAHYFIDYDSISRFIPESEKAWHAGSTANNIGIGIELCHFEDPALFKEIWDRGVWLTADICKRWNIDPGQNVVSHAWCANKWKESNHQDPTAYFQKMGKTMQDFVNDVVKEMNGVEYRVYVGYIYEAYNTKTEAVTRAWSLFNNGYKDVYLTGPDFNGDYKCAEHLNENVIVHKVHIDKWMYESYQTQKEAKDRGWYLFNNGYKDVWYEDENGYTYTYKEHQDQNPLTYKIFVVGIMENYLDEKEAYARGWALLNDSSGKYNDVYLIDKDLGLYTFSKHPEDNPLKQVKIDELWRLKIGNQQVGAYKNLDNAKAQGWALLNSGNTDVILYSPEGYTYTFHEHPEDNPKK